MSAAHVTVTIAERDGTVFAQHELPPEAADAIDHLTSYVGSGDAPSVSDDVCDAICELLEDMAAAARAAGASCRPPSGACRA